MSRPLFQLGPRLALCASLVRGGRPLCDVGTDHAYLPIWLLKQGKVPRALAVDAAPGPLRTAAGNAKRYGVEDRLVLRLSDGLRQVAPEEAEDIVIAGMGGELILRFLEETSWLQNPAVRLVLQPMSSLRDLRLGLARLGFSVIDERVVEENGRVYTACLVGCLESAPETDLIYPWMGKLKPGPGPVVKCAEKTLRDLRGRLEGARRGRGEDSPRELEMAIEAIEARYLGRKGME